MSVLLQNVNEELRYVPNARRKEISLGAFVNRSHNSNSEALIKYSGDILLSQLEHFLGKSQDQSLPVEWEYKEGGYIRTSPLHQAQET